MPEEAIMTPNSGSRREATYVSFNNECKPESHIFSAKD